MNNKQVAISREKQFETIKKAEAQIVATQYRAAVKSGKISGSKSVNYCFHFNAAELYNAIHTH